MLECIKDTALYKSLGMSKNLTHAYLFYSNDRVLNNEVALNFARTLMCANSNGCGKCKECKQFISKSHPDLYILEQDSIKVDDVNTLMSKFDTLPISSNKKVFVILNAETMNEIAQNKLLKSLEEPNQSSVFILTTSKTDKILTTIMSRLKKIFVPKLSLEDKIMISRELKTRGIDISPNFRLNSLTDMINFSTNNQYLSTLNAITNLLTNLNTTADIPRVVSALGDVNKQAFFPLMQDLFLDCLRDESDRKFDESLTVNISVKFPINAITKIIPLIENAYKMQMANVNFIFILDNLLFNILKEKFLCK